MIGFRMILIGVLFLVFLAGCTKYNFSSLEMRKLNIGMSKQDVETALEMPPYNVIGAKKFAKGIVEIWEYRKHNWADGSLAEAYWLYFLNDRLEQWGRPGDWSKEADRIYEVRFR